VNGKISADVSESEGEGGRAGRYVLALADLSTRLDRNLGQYRFVRDVLYVYDTGHDSASECQ